MLKSKTFNLIWLTNKVELILGSELKLKFKLTKWVNGKNNPLSKIVKLFQLTSKLFKLLSEENKVGSTSVLSWLKLKSKINKPIVLLKLSGSICVIWFFWKYNSSTFIKSLNGIWLITVSWLLLKFKIFKFVWLTK